MQLTLEEQKTLHVLGYLYFRMGFFDKAEHLFMAVLILTHNMPYDKNIFALLASIAISQKNGKQALDYLQYVFDGSLITGKKIIYYLLKAQALWLEQRYDEAKHILHEYLVIKGNNA